MGGKTSTSESTVTIPPEVLKRYNAVNRRAEKAASKPFKNYRGEFVAPVNEQQLAGIDTINNSVNAADPYFQQSQDYLTRGSGSATPAELDIQKYMSPYMDEVVDSTAALIDQGNEQAMTGSLGDAIKSGTFGGDRAGIAAAVLAGQQQMGRANTLAGLKQQGYQQAVGTAQQQQGVDLAARQADLARLLQASGQSTQTGVAAQQAGLAGGEAQINAGTLQQQTQQALDTAKYQQYLQKRGYPFQVAQFLANIAMGTGSLSGSTTTTTQPAPFFSDRRLKTDIKRIGRSDDGLPIYSYKYKGDNQTQIGFMADEVEKKHPEAVGVAAGFKTVDYDKATKAEGGGVMGPYGMQVGSDPYGGSSYVPEAYLQVGKLMTSDPSSVGKPQSTMSGLKELWDTGKEFTSVGETVAGWFDDPAQKASGGSVGASYLNALPEPPEPDDTLDKVLEKQDEDTAGRSQLMEAKPHTPPPSGASQVGSAASGIGSLLSGIAGIFALSDPRTKESVKRIGRTDDGMPIYKFKYRGNDHTHIGFMADDVERRKPEAVRTIDGLKHVDYERATKQEGGVVPVPTLLRENAPPEPDYQPLLEAIASKESPNYYTIHGGEKFRDFSDHPRVKVPLKDGDHSTAAGRYQIIDDTWDAAAKKLGLGDFKPASQDAAAKWIAKNDYEKRTGNSLDTDLSMGRYPEVRKGLTKTWRGLERLSDDDFAKFFEPQDAEFLDPVSREKNAYGGGVRARFADGGIPRIIEEDAPSDAVYGTVVEEEKRPTGVAPSAMMRELPGYHISDLDGTTPVRDAVPALEARTVKETPKIAEAVDYPGGVKPVDAPAVIAEPAREEKTYTLTAKSPASDMEAYIRQAAQKRGIDPDIAVRVARSEGLGDGIWQSNYRKNGVRETSYGPFQLLVGDGKTSPKGMGNDFMEQTGLDPRDPSTVQAQIDFALDRAATGGWTPWYGAKKAGVNAWDGIRDGAKALGVTTGKMVEGGKDFASSAVDGVKNVASTTGDFISDTGSGIKDFLGRNKGNTDLVLSILSGLGTMASSDSRYLGSAMLQGLGGGAKTYAELQKQQSDMASTNIDTLKRIAEQAMAYNAMGQKVSMQDVANATGFKGPIPEGMTPQDILGDYKSTTGAGEDIKSVDYRSFEGPSSSDRFGPDVEVINRDDPEFLRSFITKYAPVAGTSPVIAERVAQARERLAQIEEAGYTRGKNKDGQYVEVPVPETIATKDRATTDAANREATVKFREQAVDTLPMISQRLSDIDKQAAIFSDLESGALTTKKAELAALFKSLGIEGFTPEALADPGKVEQAIKAAQTQMLTQLGSLPGGAPAAEMEALQKVIADPNLQPEAIKMILAMQKAALLRERDRMSLRNRGEWATSTDQFAYEEWFDKNRPFSEYYKVAYEGMPTFAGEKPAALPRPENSTIPQETWDKMDPADQQKVLDAYAGGS